MALTATVVGLDQLSKYLVSAKLVFQQPVEVMPYFNLMLTHNLGAAFSFLSEAGGWQRWLFTAIAVGISVMLVVMLQRLPAQERFTKWGLALILGGALGNLIDRVSYGHVIDFIQWYYHGEHCLIGFSKYGQDCIWPSFNIADSAIFIGAVFYIYDSLLVQPKLRKARGED
jgi:signal peptidase II